jgi:hypothetical protein
MTAVALVCIAVAAIVWLGINVLNAVMDAASRTLGRFL